MSQKLTNKALNRMLEASLDAIITIDSDNKIVYINHKDPGFPLQKTKKKKILDMLLPEYTEQHSQMIKKVFNSGLEKSFEYPGPDNSWWSTRIIPLKNRKKVETVMIVFTDISKQKQFSSIQRQSHKLEAVGSLATGIAHDFNNILWIIEGNAELASAGIKPGDPARYHMEQVAKACMRAKDLIVQIISFTRSSKQSKAPLKLNIVVREVINFLKSSIPSTIKIQSTFSSENDEIIADIAQINQLLINICTNAVQAMGKKGGVLEISVVDITISPEDTSVYKKLDPGKYVVLSVNDTGCGIKPEVIDQIFKPYFTTKRSTSFSGMGLTIAKNIVENHNGIITVQSDPGKGSVFYMFFPGLKSKKPEENNIEPLPAGNETILFIDDEEDIVDAVERILKRLGYSVITAKTAIDGLKIFRKDHKKIDLVITDMTMPDMTGVELLKKIFLVRKDIPMILCTGYSALITLKKAKKSGFKEFIMKPVSRKKLAEAIRRALEK